MLGMIKRMLGKPVPLGAPKFMIIGAQKSGTTALYEYLSKHPQLVGTVPKELHFFSCENRYRKGLNFYHSLFPRIKSNQITFDASAGYLINPFAPERIYDYNPKIKLIAIVRDPVERAYSAWNMYKNRYEKNRNWFFEEWIPFCRNSHIHCLRRSDDSLFNFERFIVEELKMMEEHPNSILESSVISHGFYNDQLSRYLSLFKPEQLLIIESAQLKANTLEVMKILEEFIGVAHYDWCEEELLPVFEGSYGKEAMNEETRTQLSKYYAPHNEKLFALTGIRYKWS